MLEQITTGSGQKATVLDERPMGVGERLLLCVIPAVVKPFVVWTELGEGARFDGGYHEMLIDALQDIEAREMRGYGR